MTSSGSGTAGQTRSDLLIGGRYQPVSQMEKLRPTHLPLQCPQARLKISCTAQSLRPIRSLPPPHKPLPRLPSCSSPGCSCSPLGSLPWSQRRLRYATVTHQPEDNVPNLCPVCPHRYPIPLLVPWAAASPGPQCSSEVLSAPPPSLKSLSSLSIGTCPSIRPQLSCPVFASEPHPTLFSIPTLFVSFPGP